MARPLPSPPPEPPGFGSWREVMALALAEAHAAARQGEAPIGAVLLDTAGHVLARACNRPIAAHDPTAHAEVLCLRQAAEKLGNYRLPGCILAVTLEPCMMCVGALVHARVAGIVFGAADPKAGALVSNLDARALPFLNHRPWVLPGVLAEDCAALLTGFFRRRRKRG